MESLNVRQLEKKLKKSKRKRERTEFIVEDMLKNWPAVGWVENDYLAQQQGSGTTALFVQHNGGSQKVLFFLAAQHRRQRACVREHMRASDLSRRPGRRKETNSYT